MVHFLNNNVVDLGGSPGLVVMGGDSRSKVRGFESQHRILDGHFSHIFVVKICNVCLNRPKINEKEAGLAHFKKIMWFTICYCCLWRSQRRLTIGRRSITVPIACV